MVQVFLVLLTAVTFVLMAADPRPADSAEAKSAWTKKVETTSISTSDIIQTEQQDNDA
ncbi:ABZJ_00068 family colistin stress protein [Acinetobacter tjernbergiae]|uniref:Secreted protein n=1 Tax=Acinetobacter tjernbergiae DSM 14971 = CIP 107465 TaxID=1120928 RepID=V2WB49_9GAMM|nr:hypothetical protein [Acinetobacter tjernbergiae]ESK57244.1 hypothetical protein F990_00441 [Acinetobacter tjernbergiae DSM 14971 = CIP 107465]